MLPPISKVLVTVVPVATFFCRLPITQPEPPPVTAPVEAMITLLVPVVIFPAVKANVPPTFTSVPIVMPPVLLIVRF